VVLADEYASEYALKTVKYACAYSLAYMAYNPNTRLDNALWRQVKCKNVLVQILRWQEVLSWDVIMKS
jgi:hypothetical protein